MTPQQTHRIRSTPLRNLVCLFHAPLLLPILPTPRKFSHLMCRRHLMRYGKTMSSSKSPSSRSPSFWLAIAPQTKPTTRNPNPLGLGRAYRVVDDSVNSSKPLVQDTTPRTKYEGEFHYDADFSETNSPVIPNAQPVGIAEQRDDYEEYYNRGSPQPTGVSEKPQFDPNVRQSRSLDQLQLHNDVQPNDDDSLVHWRWSVTSDDWIVWSLKQGSDQPTESIWKCLSTTSDMLSKVRLSVSQVIPFIPRHLLGSNIERSTKISDDVYEDQSLENSNIQRSVHFSESPKNSHTHENVQPYKNRENRPTYYQIGEELEHSQRNQRVQPVRYSENSQNYTNRPERVEDNQLLQHHTLSTILGKCQFLWNYSVYFQ